MNAEDHSRGETAVVLVHGLASAPLFLAPIARDLSRQGYGRVINWSYPSITRTIADHGDRLREQLDALNSDPEIKRIHLITHSMGGIVARSALADRAKIAKLDRVIMLCPPNGGSKVASYLSRVLGWLSTPLQQLSDAPDSFVNQLSLQMPYEVGVIAARRDRVVAVERTDLPNQRDHVVLPAGHTSILFMPRLWKCINRFLSDGQFAFDC